MKSNLFIILILFSINILNSQTLDDLDKKSSIKKFKLESKYEEYSKKLEFIFTSKKVKYYKYIENDIESIFGFEIKKIELGFYKNKLFFISFSIPEKYKSEESEIYNSLKTLFGETERLQNYGNGLLEYKWGYDWIAKKTYLKFEKPIKEKKIKIWMMSLKIKNEMTNDDF